MSAFHDISILKGACDRLAEGLKLDALQTRIRTLETQNVALREAALAAAEYLEKHVRPMLDCQKAKPREIAAKLRAELEKKP